jgi:ribosomal-protein-alanine N-acetyltransferase
MTAKPVNLGEGYYLDSVRPHDRHAYVLHLGDGEIAALIPTIPQPYDLTLADSWIQHRMAFVERAGVEISFAIRDVTGSLVGSVGVDDLEVGVARDGELGYWLARGIRGRGLATRAVIAFVAHAFSALRLERVTAHTLHFNMASVRVLQKTGFKPLGGEPKKTRAATGLHDTLAFELRRSEWRGDDAV